MNELESKELRLREELRKVPSLVVAYSGGVDSAYLAYAAHQALGEKMLAVTALSASYSERDRREAEAVVSRFKMPHEFIETGRTLGAGDGSLMKDVLLPAMMPNMVDSLRITLGWCWTYLIIAEIVAADSGLGFVIWTARRYMHTADVMAGVVAIGVIGLATDQVIRVLHRRVFSYLG